MTDHEGVAAGATLAGDKDAAPEVNALHRRLSQRQLTMMAIGGAIGVGLFLGSSITIRLAGPAVILSYLLGAGIALIMSYVLTEMAVVHPVAGRIRSIRGEVSQSLGRLFGARHIRSRANHRHRR